MMPAIRQTANFTNGASTIWLSFILSQINATKIARISDTHKPEGNKT
jgi:hypothetical protein